MPEPSWIVHKFGGTSLADADRFRLVERILADRQYGAQAVVVSAMRGITDLLIRIIDEAEDADPAAANGGSCEALLDEIDERHRQAAEELLGDVTRAEFDSLFTDDRRDIADLARATALTGSASDATRAMVAGYGELWSAQLMAAFLRQAWNESRAVRWLDARKVLVTSIGELGPVVDWQRSNDNLAREVPSDFDGTLVITGFIARDEKGHPTTLGRNGSDFTASLFGALLDASQIHIWTDVDGVMTADPRWVSEVRVIEELSYNEAMELAYFGAKVLHPQTMAPAVERNIPIYIRNTFSPEAAGTRIGGTHAGNGDVVKGITSIDGMAVINLEGAGMIGVPGTAQRLFGALAYAGISVVMISQGSSEHSICFAVPDDSAVNARQVIEKTFSAELATGTIQKISVSRGLSVLAVVGDGMAGTPGVAAKVFGSLASAGVNVRAIAQGSSERNISAVIDQRESTRAVRAVHSSFYLSPQTLSIGIVGCGTVGAVLLEQMASQVARLKSQFNLDLRVRALASSQKMLLDDHGLALDRWRAALDTDAAALDMAAFVSHVQADHIPHAVIIDCTADAGVAMRYADWLAAGIHVITPNKKANSATQDYYQRLKERRRAADSRYLYETTVGAGLPIIQTVRDLRETGDRIRRIQGILSGTLAYLFNLFDGTRPFSEMVREAKASGYTEPDPRDDLSGMDVARKLVILAREIGLTIELDDIEVESLVPDALSECSVDDFLAGLAKYDDAMAQRLATATADGAVLRYVAELSHDGQASVALKALPSDHPFAHINLTDNIVQFETDRYCDNPLIVQGPGAGPAVTAAGVFADLLRLSAYLGAAV